MPYYTPSENLPEGTGTGTQEIRDTPVQKPRNRVVDTLFSVKSYLEWRRHDTSKSITALECFCLISRGRLGDPTVRKKICISYTWLKSGAPLARYFFISRQRWIGLCCIYCFDWRMWPPQFTFRFFFFSFSFNSFFFWGGGERDCFQLIRPTISCYVGLLNRLLRWVQTIRSKREGTVTIFAWLYYYKKKICLVLS